MSASSPPLCSPLPRKPKPMSDAQKLIREVHKDHKPSRWRSFSNDNEILRCAKCKTDFGRLTGKNHRNDPDPYDLWAEHVAAEIDKALGGLRPEYIARHESGGGTIHGTLVNAEISMRAYVVRPPGVEDPGSGQLTGIESRWVSGWSAP